MYNEVNAITQKTIKSLKNIGLSENEIKVYLGILQKPQSNISQISAISGIRRTTIYPYLETLLEKGFISKTIKGKIILYIPENPENILKFFDEKRRSLENSFPILKELFDQNKNLNGVQIFSGKNQIRNLYEIMANSTTDIYTFFSPSKYFKIFGKQDSIDFNTSIYKNNVKLFDLVEDNEIGREYLKSISHSGKLLPKEFENVWMDLLIFEDKIAFISFDDLNSILIKNKNINSVMKTMYKFIWKSLK